MLHHINLAGQDVIHHMLVDVLLPTRWAGLSTPKWIGSAL